MSDEFDPNQEYLSDEDREALRVEQANLEAEKRARDSLEFWQAVFSTETGRREMMGLLVEAHAFEHPFAVGPNGFPQPEATWARYGVTAFGISLYQKWLRANPEMVNLMYLEGTR